MASVELLRGVTIAMLVISWVTVSLRVYVRAWMIKAFGADDWLALATLAVFSLHCSFVLVGLDFRSTSTNASEALVLAEVAALKWYWCAIIPYVVATALVKATVGVFLLRFSRSQVHTWTIYTTLFLITLYDIAYLFICIFQCSPSTYFWLQHLGQEGSCLDRRILTDLSFTAASLNAAADIVLGVLPIFLVKSLQLDFRTKVSVAAILGLGSISCMATIIRIPYIVTLMNTSNFLVGTTQVALWGLLELGIGLAAASIVTLKPLFKVWYTGRNPYSSRSRANTHVTSHRPKEFIEIGSSRAQVKLITSDSEADLAMDDLYSDGRERRSQRGAFE